MPHLNVSPTLDEHVTLEEDCAAQFDDGCAGYVGGSGGGSYRHNQDNCSVDHVFVTEPGGAGLMDYVFLSV